MIRRSKNSGRSAWMRWSRSCLSCSWMTPALAAITASGSLAVSRARVGCATGGTRGFVSGCGNCRRLLAARPGRAVVPPPLLHRAAALQIRQGPVKAVGEHGLAAARQPLGALLARDPEARADLFHQRHKRCVAVRFAQCVQNGLHQPRILRYRQYLSLLGPGPIRFMSVAAASGATFMPTRRNAAYILKMPKRVSGTGALRQAEKARPSTSRVSSGRSRRRPTGAPWRNRGGPRGRTGRGSAA
jgi:hypothetical protein